MKKLFFLLTFAVSLAANAPGQSRGASFFMFSGPSGFVASLSGMDSLSGGSVTNAATMDIPVQFTGYTIIIVQYTVVPLTDNVTLELEVSADGTTYDNSSANYTYAYSYNSVAGLPATSGAVAQIIPALGNTAGYHNDGFLQMTNTASTSQFPLIFGTLGVMATGGGGGYGVYHCITRTNAQQTKKIRLLFSSGNITGTYTVRGMRF